MNLGSHDLIAIMKKAAVDEGVVTAFAPGAAVVPGGRIYRRLAMAKYPIGSTEWKDAVAKAAAGPPPAVGQTAQPPAGNQPAPPPQRTASTKATAGTPGTFDGNAPSPVAALEALTADPATAWTTGQYVESSSGAKRYWDGTDWQTGIAP